ncbi:MAG: hypothetical protein J0J06_03750 [Sphingomonas sp.]|uniref:hypothetical protein n=1 Tax=Sphingomonas sp. TaxID=28214 RepID=UPI001AC0DE93|nr:hypothetical protein [Sphingomonas sp.]MBN8814546.1 hypothetical protein [Sphingomonas sp.]
MTQHLNLNPGMPLEIGGDRCRIAICDGRLVGRRRDGGADVAITYGTIAGAVVDPTSGRDTARGDD